MAKKNTTSKTVTVTNNPTQTTQKVTVKPNGNTVIIEKNKNVVATSTVKDKVKYDAAGKPVTDVTVTRTVKDVTTPITRTVINAQGEIIKQTVKVEESKHVKRVKVKEPYSNPDYTTSTPSNLISTGAAGQTDQIRSTPNRDDDGQLEPAIDATGTPYVLVGSEASTINGSVIAQTFRSTKDGVIPRIDAYVADVGASGDLTLILCGTHQTGEPDLANVYGEKTIAWSDLEPGWMSFVIDPVYVQKGGHYAIAMVSSGAHTFAIAVGGNYSGGNYFDCQDQIWYRGVTDEDLAMRVYYCEFTNLQTITTMNPISLENGIGGSQSSFYDIVPEGTNRVVQAQINGVWTDIASDSDSFAYENLPAQLLMRQILSGTKDLMPITNHDISKIATFRARTDFTGITQLLDFGTDCTSASITVTLNRFDDAVHDCTISMLKVDNTPIAAAAVSDRPTDNPLIIERTATFTFTAMDTGRVKIVGAAASALATFDVAEILYTAAA